MLPKNNEAYYEIVRDVRPNKGTILKSSVDYIKCLKHEINRLRKAELKQKDMEMQNKRLMMKVQVCELKSLNLSIKLIRKFFQELETQSRRSTVQQSANGSWNSFASSDASSSHHYQNGFASSDMTKVRVSLLAIKHPKSIKTILQHMPDVISDVQTMNLNRVDDFMEDEQDGDPMLSQLGNNIHHQARDLLSLDHLTNDPMLSASSSNHLRKQVFPAVDMSSIDPIMSSYDLLAMQHNSSCDSTNVDSLLQSDSDSLISDIDMIA